MKNGIWKMENGGKWVIMPRSVVQTMQSLHGKKEHGDSTVALDMKIVRDGNGGVEGDRRG
jgi:hypothetical protein